MPLLHVRQGAAARAQSVHVDRGGRDGRARRARSSGARRLCSPLGERPELRYRAAREWLAEHGFDSTLHYLKLSRAAVRDRTGLLPHINAGCMSAEEMAMLRPVCGLDGADARERSPSAWRERAVLITARRTRVPPCGSRPSPRRAGRRSHSPPASLDRHRRDAGRAHRGAACDRAICMSAMGTSRKSSFRISCRSPARSWPNATPADRRGASLDDRRGAYPARPAHEHPGAAEPEPWHRSPALIAAGINDWGGVSPLTPDYVNPESPWPEIERLRTDTAQAGKTLAERLTIYPAYAKPAG